MAYDSSTPDRDNSSPAFLWQLPGSMRMPREFPYREIFLKGQPQHSRFDSFRIRHPAMDRGKRAKIFAPFDALQGFSDQIREADARQAETSDIVSVPLEE